MRMRRVLFSIVVVFITCESFPLVGDIYELIYCTKWFQNEENGKCISNDYIENIIGFSHFMLSVNASINFMFYVIHDENFRGSLLKVMIISYDPEGNQVSTNSVMG